MLSRPQAPLLVTVQLLSVKIKILYQNDVPHSQLCQLWLFSHDGKVRILNFNSRCASWIKIRKTIFWTVCTPNHVANRDLREAFSSYASRKLRSEIAVWMTWPLNRVLFWGAELVWPANHFRLYTARNANSMHVWMAGYPDIILPNAISKIRSLVCTYFHRVYTA